MTAAAHTDNGLVAGEQPAMRPVVLRLTPMDDDNPDAHNVEKTASGSYGGSHHPVETWRQWWRSTAQQLWPAWKGLNRWEEAAATELEAVLGEFILLLWSVHRFTPSDDGSALFDEIVDDDLHPIFTDPVLEDIVEVAFALGAAWAEDRRRDLPA